METYRYGMKGAPAVGNGLGGLPRRTAAESGAAAAAQEYFFQNIGQPQVTWAEIKNGIFWNGSLLSLVRYNTTPVVHAFLGIGPISSKGGIPRIPSPFQYDVKITKPVKNFGSHIGLVARKTGGSDVNVGIFSAEDHGVAKWTSFTQADDNLVDVTFDPVKRLVYALNATTVYCYNYDTGALLWARQHAGNSQFLLVSPEGRLFGVLAGGVAEFSTVDGQIIAACSFAVSGTIEGVEAGPDGIVIFTGTGAPTYRRHVYLVRYDFASYQYTANLLANVNSDPPWVGYQRGKTGVFAACSQNNNTDLARYYVMKITPSGVLSIGYGQNSAGTLCAALGVDEDKNTCEFAGYGAYWKVKADGTTPTNASAGYVAGNLSVLGSFSTQALTPTGAVAGTNVPMAPNLTVGGGYMSAVPVSM